MLSFRDIDDEDEIRQGRTKYRAQDDYWKVWDHLDQPVRFLEDKLISVKYAHPFWCDEARLRELCIRLDVGLMSYENCTLIELRNFLHQRGVLAITTPIRPKRVYIQLLEQADDNRTFAPFMRLPPELRVRVYKFYFRPITHSEQHNAVPPPPVTQVSHAVRKESLPIFYQRRILLLNISFERDDEAAGRPIQRYRIDPESSEKQYISKRSHMLARHKEIVVGGPLPIAYMRDALGSVPFQQIYWRIKLPERTGDKFSLRAAKPTRRLHSSFRTNIEAALRSRLQNVVARQGPPGLTAGDVKAIEDIFGETLLGEEEAWRQHADRDEMEE